MTAPPADQAAEKCVLGSMMLSADALAECLELLTPAAFWLPAHQLVFEAVAGLGDEGKPADIHSVRAALERDGALGRAGGPVYLFELIESVPSAANGPFHARRLLELQARRDLAAAAIRIRQIADDPALEAAGRFELARGALDDAAAVRAAAVSVTVGDLATPLIAALEDPGSAPAGVGVPWPDLAALIPGLRAGEVTLVAARPSVGKSVILLNIAAHAAIRLELCVLAVSLEMSRDEWMERLLAARAGVELDRIRDRRLTDGDWDQVAKAHAVLAGCRGLRITDEAGLSVAGVRSELTALRRAGTPAGMAVIDYVQLLSGGRKRAENRQAEVSEISRSVKLLAKEFAIPVVVAAQLNRGPEQRADRRPVMSDLRESGSLENDADIIMLLHRFDENNPDPDELDVIVAKNRQGRRGTVTLAWQGKFSRAVSRAWSPSAALQVLSLTPDRRGGSWPRNVAMTGHRTVTAATR